MRTYTQTFNGQQRFSLPGRMFRLLATVNPVRVELYRGGAVVSTADEVAAGFWVEGEEFDAVQITTGALEAIKFLVGENRAGFDAPPTGDVVVTNQPAAHGEYAQAAATVTNASGLLLAVNTARSMLLVQNNHATGNIFVTTNGAAATTANGIKIAPGGVLLLDVFTPTGAINAIGDVASNTAVVVVEG